MKKSLITLLAIPALIFTSCSNAKEISATQFKQQAAAAEVEAPAPQSVYAHISAKFYMKQTMNGKVVGDVVDVKSEGDFHWSADDSDYLYPDDFNDPLHMELDGMLELHASEVEYDEEEMPSGLVKYFTVGSGFKVVVKSSTTESGTTITLDASISFDKHGLVTGVKMEQKTENKEYKASLIMKFSATVKWVAEA